MLNAVVVMILVSTVVSPWVTERYGRRLATEKDVGGETSEPYDPRILLPLSRTADVQRRLLDLAFVLKDSPATTPVHLLTVLQPDATDEEMTDAETDLRNAAESGSAAEVPIEVETRVNHNVASGIVRASLEARADLILLGRERERSLGGRLFGDVVDQVRDRTTDPVLVSRVDRPINTTERVLAVLPPAVGYHEGFSESVYLVKRLAENLGIPLEVVVVGTDPTPRQYDALFDGIEPEMDVATTSVDNWTQLRERLQDGASSDLVVLLKPRESGLAGPQTSVNSRRRFSKGRPKQ